MKIATRKLLDKSFTSTGVFAIALMAVTLLILLTPIIWKGAQAYIFKGTVEFRKVELNLFKRGDQAELQKELDDVERFRKPVFEKIAAFEADLKDRKIRKQWKSSQRTKFKKELKKVKKIVHELFGPFPGEKEPVLIRQRFGQTRWDRAQVKLHHLLYREEWVENPEDPDGFQILKLVPRAEGFKGTKVEDLFSYTEENFEHMMKPKMTFYWRFLTDRSFDSHFFGGIGHEVMGTIMLTIGAIFFAIPMGIIAAIYLCEYAKPSPVINLIRTCVSTLAGVPSIVFGLFGLAFFLNTVKVSDGKSVLAGAMTLSLMILPTVIRASEEAILAVPTAYKEAAMGLGAGKWHTVWTVILPAALPGILTGVVISMGRAAGETAPIIFTAAVSMGGGIGGFFERVGTPTMALPWSVYSLCTEHEAVNEIRHVQFGMVFTLVAVVLILNLIAIVMRAKISKKLKG